MKKTFLIALFFAVAAFAEDRIPAGAKPVAGQDAQSDTYTYTDANGTQWMYRQTPFGVTKWQASDIPKPTVPEQPNNVKATEAGDKIRFERTTPFGHYTWTKSKSDLTADEKLLVHIAAEKK